MARFSGWFYGNEASGLEDRNINYMHLDGEMIQVTPENPPHRSMGRSFGVYDYRGHDWRLWNDDGTPTPYKLFFHHFDPHTGMDEDQRQRANRRGTRNEFSLGRVYEEDETHFGLIARDSRGHAPHQLVDRDHHYMTVADGAEVDQYPRDRAARRIGPFHSYPAPFPATLDGRSPAPDPVQREAFPPDVTPRARMITRGESKIAARLQSDA